MLNKKLYTNGLPIDDKETDLMFTLSHERLIQFIEDNKLIPGAKYKLINFFNDEEWVDLGLPSGNLWCSHNLGAEYFDNEGLYYAWGETMGYVNANERNRRLGRTDGFSESAYNQTGGAAITDTILLPEHDVATIDWDRTVMIPTIDDFEELFNPNYTAIEFNHDYYGIECAIITSKINNNKIIIRRTDYINGNIVGKDPFIVLITSNCRPGVQNNNLIAILEEHYYSYESYDYKYKGRHIRPVKRSNRLFNNKNIICTALTSNQLSEKCILSPQESLPKIRLYKTDLNVFPDEVDKDDWFELTETFIFDNKQYYKWDKFENGGDDVKYSILTSKIYHPGEVTFTHSEKPVLYLYEDEEYDCLNKMYDDGIVLSEYINDEENNNEQNSTDNKEIEIGYCINNDTERFPWCDPKGKGVIYATKNLFYDSEAKAIDLGLPSETLWADRNIGADNIEDYGQYFMHGDTEGYNEDDGIKCTGNYSNNKWDGLYGCVKAAYYPYNANNPDIPIAFDAARKKLGNEWEMPTEEQLEELLDDKYTTKSFEEFNGVYGLRITSLENDNSIFLPAAGYISSTGIGGRETSGCYWSKKLISQTAAVMLDFDSGGNSTSSQSRQYGCNIRAVYKP